MQTPNLEDHLLQRALGDSEQTLTISELKFPYLRHGCRHVLLETKHREQDGGGGDRRGGLRDSIYGLLFLTSQRFLVVFKVRPSPASSLRRETKHLMRKEAYIQEHFRLLLKGTGALTTMQRKAWEGQGQG